jgi:hypothetical protein
MADEQHSEKPMMTDQTPEGKWFACPIGSCHRHQACMYTPCRAVKVSAERTFYEVLPQLPRSMQR